MCIYVSSSEEVRGEWKVILLEKWSTTHIPGENKGWVGSKQEVTSFRHSLTSLIGLLSFACCLSVRLDVTNLWGVWFLLWAVSNSELMACEGGIEV